VIRRLLSVALVLGFAAAPASAGVSLSIARARAALRADLRRAYDVRLDHATCRRRSPQRVQCDWRGRRPDGVYRGRATVTLAARAVRVTLYAVRRA
jgi:hypothetical protein